MSRRPRALLLASAALLAALAGCVQGPGADGPAQPGPATLAADLPAGWAARAIPFGDGHDHFDRSHHANLSTPNFELLGWDPLVADATGTTAGGYYCGEVGETSEGRRLAVVNSFNSEVAFVVADVTDPMKPVKVGEYVLPRVHVYDVAMSADAQHVIVAAQPDEGSLPGAAAARATLPGPAGGVLVQPLFRDACTGQTRPAGPETLLPLGPSTLLVGVHDPADPALEDAHPAPVLGPHSVSTGTVDNETYVISSITNLVHQGSYYQFFQVTGTPLGHKLGLLSVYQTPGGGGSGERTPVINGHVDGAIHVHPATGKPTAYLADWDAGLVILDMSNPRAPRQIAQWNEFRGGLGFLVGEETGNLHEALPMDDLWDGKHYTLVGQEIVGKPDDHPTGWVYVLDTTDPANPVEAGRWTLPVDVEWEQALQFSTHYVEVHDRTMFVTLYHGGVWAVDLSTPEKIAAPPTIGAFVPDRESPAPPGGGGRAAEGVPDVLDVLAYADGTLVVYDDASGIYVLRFDAADPAPAPEPWPVPGE